MKKIIKIKKIIKGVLEMIVNAFLMVGYSFLVVIERFSGQIIGVGILLAILKGVRLARGEAFLPLWPILLVIVLPLIAKTVLKFLGTSE